MLRCEESGRIGLDLGSLYHLLRSFLIVEVHRCKKHKQNIEKSKHKWYPIHPPAPFCPRKSPGSILRSSNISKITPIFVDMKRNHF